MSHEAKFPILSKIRGLKWTSNDGQGEACCPAHEDSRPSLMVNASGSKLLLECRAGCDIADIVMAVGGRWSDLFERRAEPAKPTGTWESRIVASYDYRDEKGELLFQVVRIEPGDEGRKKDFRQRRPKKDSGLNLSSPQAWEWKVKGTRHVLYRLPEVLAADPTNSVVIVEGEKDADRLAKIGFVATTNPGGADAKKSGEGKWLDEYSVSLAGRSVWIIPDKDDPGRRHADRVAKSLQGKAKEVRIVILPGQEKDVSDWLNAGHTADELNELVSAAPLWDERKPLASSDSSGPNESDNDPHRLARLFVAQHTFTPPSLPGQEPPAGIPTVRFWRGVWYRWHDGYYDPLDSVEMRCRVIACMKAEFDRINAERVRNFIPEKEGDLPPQVTPVTVTAVGNVMQALQSECLLPYSIDPPCILSEDGFSGTPAKHLISLRNGVFDLRKFMDDADDVLRPHSPSLFTMAALPIDFDPEADCPIWNKFLSRNLNDDDRCLMLQEWFGVCSTFNNSLQSFLMLEGSGSNGKSVICSVLTAFLGLRNVSHVPLECFGETFHLSGTVGKLANIVSEIGEVEKANEGTLKSYTSGDRMTFNRKNLPLFEAVPTARLVMATNALPRFADRSNGVWRRMLLLPLDVVIGSDERVAGMDSVEWWSARPGELAGIFLWALGGLHRLMSPPHKFTRPRAMVEGLAEYQLECFPTRRFLQETYEEDQHGEVSTHEAYQLYRKWCEENGNKPQASNHFSKEIKKTFPNAIAKRWVVRHDGKRSSGYTGIEVRNQLSFDAAAIENKENKNSASLF
jgi:putative DNA primase/helicase